MKLNFFKPKRIFLDYASTTPLLPEVKREMSSCVETFYNPSSIYSEGVNARQSIEGYRARVANVIGSRASGIIFTSGGTESDNLAIIGAAEAFVETTGRAPHVIISAIEHPAVMEAAEEVKRRGGQVSVAKVNEFGLVSPDEVIGLIKPNTAVVSIMLANNEIGTIEPISRIGRGIRERREKSNSIFPYFHTDACQAPNYLSTNIETLHVDMLTLDGSKIYGPKGVGVLAVRPTVSLRPIIWGGGQEKGMRSGTEDLSRIAGFTVALEIVHRDKEQESKRLLELKEYFLETIQNLIPYVQVNGSVENSLPNILNISVPGNLGEYLVLALDAKGVAVSAGSACASTKTDSSQVLKALGKEESDTGVRFSFGRFTTKKEVEETLKIFCIILHHAKMIR